MNPFMELDTFTWFTSALRSTKTQYCRVSRCQFSHNHRHWKILQTHTHMLTWPPKAIAKSSKDAGKYVRSKRKCEKYNGINWAIDECCQICVLALCVCAYVIFSFAKRLKTPNKSRKHEMLICRYYGVLGEIQKTRKRIINHIKCKFDKF